MAYFAHFPYQGLVINYVCGGGGGGMLQNGKMVGTKPLHPPQNRVNLVTPPFTLLKKEIVFAAPPKPISMPKTEV